MKHTFRHGFTIVEMVIVIAVIAILATIVSVAYVNIQEQARNTKLKDAASKVAGAVQLFYSKYERMPRGGAGSTAAIGSGTECAGGANGFFATAVYTCSLEDTLRASGYLPAGFSASLPKNTLYAPTSSLNLSLMVYAPPAAGKIMVFYTMEGATSEDTATFNTQLTRCGYVPANPISQRDTYGMRGGVCADL